MVAELIPLPWQRAPRVTRGDHDVGYIHVNVAYKKGDNRVASLYIPYLRYGT